MEKCIVKLYSKVHYRILNLFGLFEHVFDIQGVTEHGVTYHPCGSYSVQMTQARHFVHFRPQRIQENYFPLCEMTQNYIIYEEGRG